MEDIISAAMSARTSQGYALLEEARDAFIQELLNMAENYRVINFTSSTLQTHTHTG